MANRVSTLFWLRLECTSEYLEDFVARVDALPALQWMVISSCHSLSFDIPGLPQFIPGINAFKFTDQARICTYPDEDRFTFSQKIRTGAELTIIFTAASGTISSLLRVCCSSSPPHPFESLGSASISESSQFGKWKTNYRDIPPDLVP
jgi:hypothetical protein